MQAVARSRSPMGVGLRERSRSASPRRPQWKDPTPMDYSHAGGIRGGRMGGSLNFKTEYQTSDAASRGTPFPSSSSSSAVPHHHVGGLYSSHPNSMHRSAIALEEGPSGPGGGSLVKSPLVGPEGEAPGPADGMEKMMTFRTFVIDRVGEEMESGDAVVAYNQYKEDFRRNYIGRLFRQLKDLPALAEKYNPQFVLKQLDESKQRCRLSASEFMKLLIEERFNNIQLISPISRPVSATSRPFRLLIGPRIAQEAAFQALSDPYYIPEDPDEFCLCLRNVPAHISKWDILDHLTAIGVADGLVDLSVTVPERTQLTAQSVGELSRTAWVKYDTDDACAAAEIKLENTNFKRYTCRPVRRIHDISNYVFRIAPSETCHPARVCRDLRLSARLIVKLDDVFGVSGLLGVSVDDTEKELLTEARCQQHPVLAELPNVLQGLSNRSLFEQLDLQILYLRVVHCTCYYSGRRFSSPREIWEVVGPLYVRPKVLEEEVLELQGFSTSADLQSATWDSDYTTAADIFKRLQQNPRDVVEPYDEHDYFMQDETAGHGFEPSDAAPVDIPKDDEEQHASHSTLTTPLVKMEESVEDGDGVSMVDDVGLSLQESKPVIKTETDAELSRGRFSPWLKVLDTRITSLLRESFEVPVIDEDNEEVARLWNDFCKKNMSEVEAEKWRCSLCKKLFRGSDFVHKHLKNKHGSSLVPIVDQVKLNYMVAAHQQDHFRIPIVPPKPTPYLYRTVLKHQRRRESPGFVGLPGLSLPPGINLPGPHPLVFPPFIPSVTMGSRRGTLNSFLNAPAYKDLDAPKPVATANGNLRAAIQYDDL